ncbi:GRB10-interacting GYF protein 2-like isoform X5 [Anguilla rostrata]|uniref:GRB10-interacting GYF protein 2-like isoform X5 n=1 Tax=Anguilla rostrata TaxID=7938 RepID=UPI0030D1890C
MELEFQGTMAETQMLNFGPEWLRALSGGGGGGGGGSSNSVASPPLSPALPKYKLADYRYGREEMLALYVKDNKIPLDLHDKEFLPILQEEPLPPLALVPFTEEEQRNFSMSVNSAAVLRLTGRGVGTVVGAPRGRSSSRGRGRGRGEGGFYQRSFDDGEGGFGRGGREMHRSQSWEERGDKRFEKPGRKDPDVATAHFQLNHTVRANYEEGVAVPGRKHEFTRSESENWRVSREEQNGGDDDEGGWRLAGSRRDGSDRWCPPSPEGPRSAGWDQRRRFPFDGREEERGYRRAQDDERDSLPEWCLEDAEEETGTFDSSGAFLSLKGRAAELSGLPQMKQKAPKEPILEEAELDFRPAEDCEAHVDPDETKETDTPAGKEADGREDSGKSEEEAAPPLSTPPCPAEPQLLRPTPSPPHQPEREEDTPPPPEAWPVPSKAPPSIAPPTSTVAQQQLAPPSLQETSTPTFAATQQRRPPDMPQLVPGPLPFPAGIMAPIGQPEALPHDADDDEGLKHFEQEAEKMVAYLQEDDKLSASGLEPAKPAALPLSHEAALKWFYKDPQGEIQGPFSNQEMMEWFQAGYFTMTLLVKRGCDELFQPLGEIIKMWGRVPFTPGPSPPPMLGDVDQARLKRQQELTALNLYQLQQLQYQYLIRQQYAQALAQQQKAAALGAPQQPQQQQHLNLLLQQYQALKMRTSEQSLVPPVTRSMSVPDSGSVWELQNPSPQASASATVAHAARSAWEGGSVWDLPGDSVAQAPSLEQIQQLEKAKAAAKLEQERKEAELRAKREEEERKRREEALLAQQEEERKRREEEELARRQQEEALRLQQEQEEALRRQKEEEEEEARRLQERKRREEEERRQREELLRKQEEERKKQEELEALRRLEEEKRLEEEARLLQQEEQKKREQDVQRQRQQEALRRLQQQQQQQQLAQMKLPSSSKWGQQAAGSLPLCQAQSALSLAEIQKLEEERERQALEERHQQQQELMRVIQQQQQQQQQQAQSQSQPQSRLPGWGSASRQPSATPKSLLEIQREEAQQMKQRKEAPQPGCPQQTRTSSSSSSSSVGSVWGSASSGSLQWGTDAGSIWSSPADASNANLGFWDEAAKEAATTPPQKNPAKKNKSNANLSHSSSGRANKKAEEEEKLLKLFQGVNQTQDGFTQWCEQALHTLNTANNLDVPTFTSFLKEVESPYEVHDYVRAYLGDTPESKEFAKHFLERRAKQNANHQTAPPQPPLQPAQPARPAPQQKAQQQPDSVWGGTQPGRQSIFQSNHSSLQQARFETVTSGKKKKKQKMVRADPSLLGFSVNASSERLNMGEIETVEDF